MKIWATSKQSGGVIIDSDQGKPLLQLQSFYKADEEHDRFIDAVDTLTVAQWMCHMLAAFKRSEWKESDAGTGRFCTRCQRFEEDGHKDDCYFLKVKAAFGELW